MHEPTVVWPMPPGKWPISARTRALRDHAARHQVGGEDEERDRQQRADVDAAEHLLGNDHLRHVRVERGLGEQRRHAHDQQHLEAERQHREREDTEQGDDHGRTACLTCGEKISKA
jgi:hypothetical protein